MDYSEDIQKQIEAYLLGTLSEVELQQFEALLEEDNSLATFVGNLKEVNEVLQNDSWAFSDLDINNPKTKEYLDFYLDDKNKAFYNQLKDLSNGKEKKKFNIRTLWQVASVAALIVIGIFIFKPSNSIDYNQLYSSYMNVDEIPSFTERGINDSVFALIEKNFNAKNYSQTIEIISMYETNFPPEKTDFINIYKGITYTELGRYDEATSLLSEESVFSESLYNQMSQWFLALNYLKAEKIAEAKQILKEIAKNKQHYKFEEARAILKKLD
ncbi:MAG: hypothetical protein R2728_08565 [Chitinophagales bacterium]